MMAPLNRVHQTIARNLIVALVPALRASRPDLDVVHEVGVEIPGMTTFIAEPDVVILPQPADYSTYHAHFVFVAEIRSPSNEPEDLDAKVRAYGRAPENLATLVLAQDRIAADLYRRAEGWMRRELTGHDAVITLPEFGLALPLGQLYTGTPLAM
jgi:Uma2 family endonuclease